MLLRELGGRLRRRLEADRPRTTESGQGAAARQDRTAAIADLQPEVRRLQQAIADLGRPESDAAIGELPVVDARLPALQDALKRTQKELARYQGRI